MFLKIKYYFRKTLLKKTHMQQYMKKKIFLLFQIFLIKNIYFSNHKNLIIKISFRRIEINFFILITYYLIF